MKNGDHLFLVDGSAYIFRAYHALPPLTRKSDGLPVGAVSGFCNMLWKLLRQARDTSVGVTPTHFAVIFDYSSKTFRNEMYPEYKANRSAPPEDLVPQFGLIRQATHAFGLPCIEMEGFEADDIIATYAKLAREAGGDATIISSDKDLMQLVNEKVSMYDPMKDKDIGIPEVIEKWGVGPEKMIDLQALTGDSVDNIPGVPGIGPKTAAQLLDEYGNLDTLLDRAGEIKQAKRRENLIEHREKALLSRELVRLKDDVPGLDALDALVLDEPDGPKLVAFLKAMEFTSLTRRVAEDTGTDAGAVDAATVETQWGADAHGPDMDAALPTSPLWGGRSGEQGEAGAGGGSRQLTPTPALRADPPHRGEGGMLPALARRAAILAKADLQTEVVGEFPEVQGTMGRTYARMQGEDAAVAAAIEEHYKPQGPSDAVPADPVSIAVALADKLDTLVGFWAIDEKPTGSKDPFALRRAALGVIRIVAENGVRLRLSSIGADADLLSFFHDRLKVYLRDNGARHDLIDAVLASGSAPLSPLAGEMSAKPTEGGEQPSSQTPPSALPGISPARGENGQSQNDDLLLVIRRVEALSAFLATEEGVNLLAGTKRAANILAAEEKKGALDLPAIDAALFATDEERALFDSLEEAEHFAAQAIAAEDYAKALGFLAALRQPVDAFFEAVLVNADDPAVRLNRLALLARIRAATGQVADFSKIAG